MLTADSEPVLPPSACTDPGSAVLELAAIRGAHAVLELAPDGTILSANDRFLDLMGYRPDQLAGRHHRILVPPEQRDTPDYAAFWRRLGEGACVTAEFKRLHSSGRDLWIQGSYTPVVGDDGRVRKIVKFATDVTAAKIKSADDAGQIADPARLARPAASATPVATAVPMPATVVPVAMAVPAPSCGPPEIRPEAMPGPKMAITYFKPTVIGKVRQQGAMPLCPFSLSPAFTTKPQPLRTWRA